MGKLNRQMYCEDELVDEFSVSHANTDYTVSVFSNSMWHDFSMIAWMSDASTGELVGMCRFFTPTENYLNCSVLCDIEVNPEYRGRGLSLVLIKALGEKYTTLYTTGNYSVTGHKAFAGNVPVLEGQTEHVSNTVEYKFVNWVSGHDYK